MKHISTQAIILRRISFAEADRILTVLTPHHGKISLFAKGVRRPKSKLAGGLELFSVSDVVYIDGKSDLKTIVSARLGVHYGHIVLAGMETTMAAYDFLKRIDEFTEDHCSHVYFDLLNRGLRALNNGEDVYVVRAWFLHKLLVVSGRGINVHTQADGSFFTEDVQYVFDRENMGFVAQDHGVFEPKHIKFIRLLGKADSPEHLLRINDAPSLAQQVLGILQQSVAVSQA